jgi:hypothetical protein
MHRDIHRCGKSVWNGKTKAAYTTFSVEDGDKRFRGRAIHWCEGCGGEGEEHSCGPPCDIALTFVDDRGSRREPPGRSGEGGLHPVLGSSRLPHQKASGDCPWLVRWLVGGPTGASQRRVASGWGTAAARLSSGGHSRADAKSFAGRPWGGRDVRSAPSSVAFVRPGRSDRRRIPQGGEQFTQGIYSWRRDIHSIHSCLCTLAAGEGLYAGSGGRGEPRPRGCGRKRRRPPHAWALRSCGEWFDYRAGLNSRLTAIGRTSILRAPLCAPVEARLWAESRCSLGSTVTAYREALGICAVVSTPLE